MSSVMKDFTPKASTCFPKAVKSSEILLPFPPRFRGWKEENECGLRTQLREVASCLPRALKGKCSSTAHRCLGIPVIILINSSPGVCLITVLSLDHNNNPFGRLPTDTLGFSIKKLKLQNYIFQVCFNSGNKSEEATQNL